MSINNDGRKYLLSDALSWDLPDEMIAAISKAGYRYVPREYAKENMKIIEEKKSQLKKEKKEKKAETRETENEQKK